MNTTVSDLLSTHPENEVYNPEFVTQSNKAWAQSFSWIRNLTVHTWIEDELAYTDFKAFIQQHDDDTLRLSELAVHPNRRKWRLETEADCELWFHSEVSNIVLAAWSQYPSVTQTSQTKPPTTDVSIPESVDSTYSMKFQKDKKVLAIGEMKRNLINPDLWQQGDISSNEGQKKLSRELRGYAAKYQCPQVFCFDGEISLLLQFRANQAEDIRMSNCPVDCWVLGREDSFTTLRAALYMLLVQGFRRIQGAEHLRHLSVGGLTPRLYRFYDGQPIWGPDNLLEHPGGYQRSVDASSGAIKWTHPEDPTILVWETPAFWDPTSK